MSLEKIPKVIFQTSKSKLQSHVKDLIFKACPNFTYVYFSDNDIMQFFHDNVIEEFKDISTVFNSFTIGKHKTDLFRYYYLYINGGIFLDSDAMFYTNIENLISDINFFSVNSTVHPKVIYQGIIGCSPKNNIIYIALKDAYNTKNVDIVNNYHYFCKSLYKILQDEKIVSSNKVKLFDEIGYSDKCRIEYEGKLVAFHYFSSKTIPPFSYDGAKFVPLVYDYLNVIQFGKETFDQKDESKDRKIRLGQTNDGGYVIGLFGKDSDKDIIKDSDKNRSENYYDCYISAGVSDEESFTRDFMRLPMNSHLNEFNSFAFDGTINSYPYQYTKNISFVRKNIGPIHNNDFTNLHSLMSKYKDIFLKIDIEGGEFSWILSLNETQLKSFKQIVIEIHGITHETWLYDITGKMKTLDKLNKTHYIIHAHANNNAPVFHTCPEVIELTYIRKDLIDYITPNKTQLPFWLDKPNKKEVDDVSLNFPPFVNK